MFYKMQDLPKVATDLKGNKEPFSVPVLVFDKDTPTFCNIGHYNFDTETWNHFGEDSMLLICWCYIPDPTDFVRDTDLEFVLHDGFVD